MTGSNYIFRSADQWKANLLKLPDSIFFDLMRSVLGDVKSPFNKQSLIEDLSNVLLKRDVQKTIEAYIDVTDHKVITAIAALNEPTESDLESFFSCELSYTDVHLKILNLEERLIVYRIRKKDGSLCLALNPLLKKVLSPFMADKSVLFPHKKITTPLQENNIDFRFAVFTSLILEESDFWTVEGNVKKSIYAKTCKILSVEDAAFFIAALEKLKVLNDENSQVLQEEFFNLDTRSRLTYIASGMYFYLKDKKNLCAKDPSNIVLITSLISLIIEETRKLKDALFLETTIKRLIKVILKNESFLQIQRNTLSVEINVDFLITAMEKANLIIKGQGSKAYYYFADNGSSSASTKEKSALIAFDSAYSFFPMPEISFKTIIILSKFCEVKDSGGKAQFIITRDSVTRSLNKGTTSNEIFEILDTLSMGRLNSNVKMSLKDWERRYNEVCLYDTLTVVLSSDMQYLAKTESFKSLILCNPASGIFILNSNDKKKVTAILKKAGVQSIAEPKELNAPEKIVYRSKTKSKPEYFMPLKFANGTVQNGGQKENERTLPEDCQSEKVDAEYYKKKFRTILNGMQEKMLIKTSEREELSDRIERSLIFCRSQLEYSSLRYEKRQANSMDYVGKIAISKQALTTGEILELEFNNESGKPVQYTGYAKSLEKTKTDTILSLQPIQEDLSSSDMGMITVSIGKIQSMRRIKKSIFSV
ncbi:MAG: hypothetical protein Ta2F_07360 [Termitinemataceae bacterium]|nr:MAG: hypothetical protein Ta2F_07360 [Termitinemataceae bacterium]